MIEERKATNTWIEDDDSIYVYGLKKLMSIKGINTNLSHFINGQEGINALKKANENQQLPDIILLDINMPVMDGWEFMNEFAKLKPQLGKNITIYIVTPSLDLNDIHRAKSIPEVADYIFKPVKISQLTEIFSHTQYQTKERIKQYGT